MDPLVKIGDDYFCGQKHKEDALEALDLTPPTPLELLACQATHPGV